MPCRRPRLQTWPSWPTGPLPPERRGFARRAAAVVADCRLGSRSSISSSSMAPRSWGSPTRNCCPTPRRPQSSSSAPVKPAPARCAARCGASKSPAAPVIGAVLTKYNAKTAGYGADYGYGYGYGQAHQHRDQLAHMIQAARSNCPNCRSARAPEHGRGRGNPPCHRSDAGPVAGAPGAQSAAAGRQ